ncbi:MAG: large subunit ribosomal protein [Pyrinomonadaceae bacterium]|jgi:large subunit ribosomal protein L22|nr:large subunit ribosomal protein [Pyrinomonadaceae bacterium]
MEAIASARYLRGSAQKARLVVDMIRGEDVNRALAILRYSDKRASNLIEKCVRSAIANANEAAEKANVAIDPDDLWVKTAFVDRGPTKGRRRVRPAPQGRAYREQRHFCHVTILLSNDARPEAKGPRHGDGKAAAAKPAKLVENKARKRGGAAAAPRAKRVAPRSEASDKSDAAARAEGEKKATKRAAKKKTKVDE